MRLIEGNIYKYKKASDCGYFCFLGETGNRKYIHAVEVGIEDQNRIHLRISDEISNVIFMDHLLEISTDDIISPWYVSGKLVTVSHEKISIILNHLNHLFQESLTEDYSQIIFDNYSICDSRFTNVLFIETMINHMDWNNKKTLLKFKSHVRVPNVMRYHVYMANLGSNIGSEINKLRPVLIWKQHKNSDNPNESSFFVFPISSSKKMKKYYYNVEFNLNGNNNYILINDGRRISAKRIYSAYFTASSKVASIDYDTKEKVKQAISKYFDI